MPIVLDDLCAFIFRIQTHQIDYCVRGCSGVLLWVKNHNDLNLTFLEVMMDGVNTVLTFLT